MQRDHEAGHENYLHNGYDTYVFYPAFTEMNVLTMVRNGFVEALNKRLKFPSAVVILISDQIIMEDPLYLPSEIDRKIKWILREIDAAIKIRKSLLPLKAYTFGEPRVMWVRGFQNTRANYISEEIMMKYNNMLRKLCMAKAVYTIPVDSYNDAVARCFDYDGKTQIQDGFNLLWYDIIKGIKKHDKSDKEAEIAAIVKEYCPVTSDRRPPCHEPNHRRDKTTRPSYESSSHKNDRHRSSRHHNSPHNRSRSRAQSTRRRRDQTPREDRR